MILPVIVATLCAIGALGHRVAGPHRRARPGTDRWRPFGWAPVAAIAGWGVQGWRERRPTHCGEERHDRGREVPVGPD